MNQQKVVYYRCDERSEAGEIMYVLRFYTDKAKHVSSRTISSAQLRDELDALRKEGYLITRVEA